MNIELYIYVYLSNQKMSSRRNSIKTTFKIIKLRSKLLIDTSFVDKISEVLS